jgi:hypothetical protein
MNLRELVYSKKRISAFPGWVEPEAETGYAWFDAPLEIEGVTEVGFVCTVAATRSGPIAA